MLRWERVPILGNNPVFCFEARRLWRPRTIVVISILALTILAGGWKLPPAISSVLGARGEWFGLWGRMWTLLTGPMASLQPRPLLEDLVAAGARPLDGHYLRSAYLLTLWLSFLVKAGARYLVPALAAASMATDRITGRLQPLLVSRMSPGEILLGKAIALAAPFAVLALLVVVPLTCLAVANAAFVVLGASLIAELVLGLTVGALVGLRVGLSPRREPAVAMAASIAIAGIAVPTAVGGLGLLLGWLLFKVTTGLGVSRTLGWLDLAAARAVVQGAALVLFWVSAQHALQRVTEWDRSAQV